ncbi:MAG: hypothetical protein AUG45_02490 [Ktedonobacter sp. 13_1_20CM_3_54_15]|nr:MAG: hypothetical protein AUH05_08815 [Ktedonobacter sp. 13_2_20CM_53_11]OLB61106.1 MAG: hypothetical protein AUH94_06645 [Ktedonobacter sp. 13_2_20CM_2_54_8]OLE35088.1 MAG: hypothetical protein AUG45_02490 [Ktedonobacter sp. 13_1_20CM_3_54_15]
MNGSLKFNPLRLHTYILVRKRFGLVQSNLKASKRFFISCGRMARVNVILNLIVSKHKGKMV